MESSRVVKAAMTDNRTHFRPPTTATEAGDGAAKGGGGGNGIGGGW